MQKRIIKRVVRNILVVELHGGLCNRLRVLLCAIAYSEATNRELLIYWSKDNNFAIPLKALWRHEYQEIGKVSARLLGLLTGRQYENHQIDLQVDDSIMYVNTIHSFCVEEFQYPLASYLSRLSLVNPIKEMIEIYSPQFFEGNTIVGVSVRSTQASVKTLEFSPPEWFVTRINQIYEQFPYVRFFLSTDSREVSNKIRSGTRATIYELPKNYRYNQKDGVREAVCDLYLLAKSSYILGSYWSSFSEMAYWIRGESAFEHSQIKGNEDRVAGYLARTYC